MKTYDVVVIGSGPGGYVAALECAKHGLKTACIEKHSKLGGTCLHVGCIPSKSLLYATELYATMQKKGETLGLTFSGLSYDFEKMMQNKSHVIDSLAGGISTLMKSAGVDVIHGQASIKAPGKVAIGDESFQAKKIILATGSKPIALPFLPFDEKTTLSSTGALALTRPPKTMNVIGGGVIGVEIASIYNRLGTEVTVVEALGEICTGIDHSINAALLKILQKQGITFHLKTTVKSASQGSLTLSSGETLQADVTLVSVGRRPNVDTLQIEGLKLTPNGFVEIDNNYQTSLPNIYAIGDLTPGPMLAHRASDDAVAVAAIIAGKSASVNYATVPNVIYTHPEVAATGLTENEAKSVTATITATSYFKANGRAKSSLETDGFVKVVVEKATGRLLGLHIIGPHASEMITEGVIAINAGQTVKELIAASHPHPTLSEAIKEALHSVAV